MATDPELAPTLRTDPYAALRSPNFCIYAIGFIFAVIGDQIMEMAVGWDLYQRTHKALPLGWIGLCAAAPVILLALPAGHIADRFDRRRVVLFSQIVRTLGVLALGCVSYQRGAVALMYALVVLIACTKAIGWPARAAMLPALVEDKVFPNAVNWNSSAFQVSAMVGPAIGGWIVAYNVPAAYITAAICAAVFGLSMFPLRVHRAQPKIEEPSLRSLAAGVRFVWSTKIILATITLDLFAVLFGGMTALFPIFAKDILKVGAVGFGWLRAAPALGAIIMGIIMAHLPPMKHAGRAMLWAVAGFGVTSIVFGLSRNIWLSLATLFLAGALDNVSVIVRHTLVQVLTPDSMRGRVSAVNNIFIGASNDLGAFESGLTADLFGTIVSVVGGGIGTLLVVGLTALIWPQVRSFGSIVDAKAPELEEMPREQTL